MYWGCVLFIMIILYGCELYVSVRDIVCGGKSLEERKYMLCDLLIK